MHGKRDKWLFEFPERNQHRELRGKHSTANKLVRCEKHQLTGIGNFKTSAKKDGEKKGDRYGVAEGVGVRERAFEQRPVQLD